MTMTNDGLSRDSSLARSVRYGLFWSTSIPKENRLLTPLSASSSMMGVDLLVQLKLGGKRASLTIRFVACCVSTNCFMFGLQKAIL